MYQYYTCISTMYHDKGQLTEKQQNENNTRFLQNLENVVYDCTPLSLVKCVINQSSDSSGSHLFILLLLSQFITLLLQLENGGLFIIAHQSLSTDPHKKQKGLVL